MEWGDVLNWLRSVEWSYMVQVVLPMAALLSVVVVVLVGVLVLRKAARKEREVQALVNVGRELYRRMEEEHMQAAWLLNRMKEKIEERRREQSRSAVEGQLDAILQDQGTRRFGVSLDEAKRGLENFRAAIRSSTETGTVSGFVATQVGGMTRIQKRKLTEQEIAEWSKSIDAGDDKPF